MILSFDATMCSRSVKQLDCAHTICSCSLMSGVSPEHIFRCTLTFIAAREMLFADLSVFPGLRTPIGSKDKWKHRWKDVISLLNVLSPDQ